MSNRKTINQAKKYEKYTGDLRFIAEKYPHLTDTILSNGQKTFDPQNSLFQNLNKNTFFLLDLK